MNKFNNMLDITEKKINELEKEIKKLTQNAGQWVKEKKNMKAQRQEKYIKKEKKANIYVRIMNYAEAIWRDNPEHWQNS